MIKKLKYLLFISISIYGQTYYCPDVHYARKNDMNNLGTGLALIHDINKYHISLNWNIFTPLGKITEDAAKYANNFHFDLLYTLNTSRNFFIGPGIHYNRRLLPSIVFLMQFNSFYDVPILIKSNLTQEQYLLILGFKFNLSL